MSRKWRDRITLILAGLALSGALSYRTYQVGILKEEVQKSKADFEGCFVGYLMMYQVLGELDFQLKQCEMK